MDFAFTGSCTAAAPGICAGNSASACPGGYIGSNTEDGAPVQCTADNTGVSRRHEETIGLTVLADPHHLLRVNPYQFPPRLLSGAGAEERERGRR